MEKIKVGEYVRTEKGIIDKVIQILNEGIGVRFFGERLEDTIIITNRDILSERRIDSKEIVKHSPSIIDLIEVGDYVNGYRVYHIAGHYVSVESFEKYDLCFEEQDIKTIVTHEQMSNIEYRLEN